MKNQNKGDIVIYQAQDGLTQINVRFEDETVWLSQQQMASLYQTSRTNIVEHIQHIYEEGELISPSTNAAIILFNLKTIVSSIWVIVYQKWP